MNMPRLLSPEERIFRDMDDNLDRLMIQIQQLVEGKNKLRARHKAEIEAYEHRMFSFLWQARTWVKTTTLARAVGISRQMLYTKWTRFGFIVEDSDEV